MTMQSSIAAARIGEPKHNADGTAIFEFRFGADDPVFAGHFPNRPLLPGIFQLEMARVAAESVLNFSDFGSSELVRMAMKTRVSHLRRRVARWGRWRDRV